MKREGITNSQDYKATEAALEWWKSLPLEVRREQQKPPDIVDAYADGVIYGWNNPNWRSVKDELPPKRKNSLVLSDIVFIHTTGGDYLSAVYDYQDKKWIDVYNIETLKSDKVTHWMPIVTPGKEE